MLEDVSREVIYNDLGNLQAVMKTLTREANLGCERVARLGTKGHIAKSTNLYGKRLVDDIVYSPVIVISIEGKDMLISSFSFHKRD